MRRILATLKKWFSLTSTHKQLIARNDFLENIINLSADPIFVKNEQHIWVLLNDAVCEFINRPREALLGHGDYDIFPQEEADTFRKIDNKVLATGEEIENEESFTDLNGKTHIISTKKTLFVDPAGNKFIIGTIRDLTDMRAAESKAREHLRQLAHCSRMISIGELTSSIAHTLGQPLTAISLYASGCLAQAQKNNLPSEIITILGKISEQSERAGNIIHHLKMLLERGNSQRRDIDLATLINSMLAFIKDTTRDSLVNIEYIQQGALPTVNIDPIQIEQVLINLIQNSMDAMLAAATVKPHITLQTSCQEQQLIIRIRDNGPGINLTNPDKILEPFYTTKQSGMGIGLSMCTSILESHRGKMEFTTTLETGCEVVVRLPVIADLDLAPKRPALNLVE